MFVAISIQGVSPILLNRFPVERDARTGSAPSSKEQRTAREEAERGIYRDSQIGVLYIPSSVLFAALADAARHHQHRSEEPPILAGALFIDDVELSFGQYEFQVDSREVCVPGSGEHVMRHRARLDEWDLYFELEFDESVLDPKFVRALVDDAGSKVGLGDDTPATGGTFGRFVVTEWDGGDDDDDDEF